MNPLWTKIGSSPGTNPCAIYIYILKLKKTPVIPSSSPSPFATMEVISHSLFFLFQIPTAWLLSLANSHLVYISDNPWITVTMITHSLFSLPHPFLLASGGVWIPKHQGYRKGEFSRNSANQKKINLSVAGGRLEDGGMKQRAESHLTWKLFFLRE